MKKLWDLKKGFSNLELEGHGWGIIMGVTRLLLLGTFYNIQTKRDQHFDGECISYIKGKNSFTCHVHVNEGRTRKTQIKCSFRTCFCRFLHPNLHFNCSNVYCFNSSCRKQSMYLATWKKIFCSKDCFDLNWEWNALLQILGFEYFWNFFFITISIFSWYQNNFRNKIPLYSSKPDLLVAAQCAEHIL